MKRHLLISLLIALVLVPVSTTIADVMDFKGTALTAAVRLHASGYIADGERVLAGQYLYGYHGQDYHAFCVDIDHYAGTTEVVQRPVTSLNNGDLVGYLFDTYSPAVTTGNQAAGLGVAIWEVLFESSANAFDPLGGEFRISDNTAVGSIAAGYLSTLPPTGTYTPSADLVVLDSRCKQDMLIAIPEPAAAMLIVLGSLGLLGRRKQARRPESMR